jgi:hypothetical protein
MKAFIAAGGLVFALAAVPAAAFDDDANEEATEEVDPYAPDAVRCERVAVTGSRVRRTRVCMTNAQWAEQRRAGNRDASRMIDQSTRAHEQLGN